MLDLPFDRFLIFFIMFNFNLSIKMSTRKRFSLKLIKLMITVAISVAASLGLVRSNVANIVTTAVNSPLVIDSI